MFCIKCGTPLPDDAQFCNKCGTSLQFNIPNADADVNTSTNASAKLVKAQCTNCSAPLEVDASKDAAICPFCNTPYIVEKAINNYNINLNSGNVNIENAVINVSNASNIDNMIIRAENYEKDGDLEKALEYYNRILDIDISHEKAEKGAIRVKYRIDNYIYLKADANSLLVFGKILLLRDKMIFVNRKGVETVYYMDRISNPVATTTSGFSFNYSGKFGALSYGSNQSAKIVEFLSNAKKGLYPRRVFMSQQERMIANEIREHFSEKNKSGAVKYYRQITGASKADAVDFVNKIY